MFGVLAPFAPPPPTGAKPGSLWATESYVRDLLGDGVDALHSERRRVLFDGVTPDAFVDLMRSSFGPVLRIFKRFKDDAVRTEQLDHALRLFARSRDGGAHGKPRLESEYLLTLARRRR